MSPLPASPAPQQPSAPAARARRWSSGSVRCAACRSNIRARARPGTWPGSRRRSYTQCRRRRRCRRAPASRTGPATWRCASAWRATAGWRWTNCGAAPGSARACGVPAGMASPRPCRPATKACCWWPAIRRRAPRWTGSRPAPRTVARRRPWRHPRRAFLAADPQPALLDGEAQAVEFNQASLPCLASGRARPGALTSRPTMGNWRAPAWAGAALGEWRRSATDASCSGSSFPDSAEARVLARCQTPPPACAASARRRPAGCTGLITENTTDLISRHTLDAFFLDASPASWTLLGYWPEELRGRPAQALFHPQDRGPGAARARSAGAGRLPDITYRIRHCDGRYRWFETASRAIRETYTGAVVEVVSVSRDVTRRVEAEENRRRLAEVVEANTDLVLFVEHGGRVTTQSFGTRRPRHRRRAGRRRRWNTCWPATPRRGWPKRVGDRRAMAACGAARGACNRRTASVAASLAGVAGPSRAAGALLLAGGPRHDRTRTARGSAVTRTNCAHCAAGHSRRTGLGHRPRDQPAAGGGDARQRQPALPGRPRQPA